MKYSLQLKISLAGIKPLVWRRVVVNSDISLADFNTVIQSVMPWFGGHLHQFIKDGVCYVAPCEGFIDEQEDSESFELYNNTKVGDLLQKEEDFVKYEYDFGDSWIHNISVEKVLAPLEERKAHYIKGKNMAPPEDCGGAAAYMELKAILSDSSHPQYAEKCEWLGMEEDEIFDPTYIGCDDDDIDDALFEI
ncbi:MAG: plasmid pRiA4b ORF-3 family protein [Rikenellaceae bacterium]